LGAAVTLKTFNMKLIDRLKPEYKQELEDHRKLYPAMVGRIEAVLAAEDFVCDIRVGEAVIISDLFGKTVQQIYSLFNPST
jgi:hypothetical protein